MDRALSPPEIERVIEARHVRSPQTGVRTWYYLHAPEDSRPQGRKLLYRSWRTEFPVNDVQLSDQMVAAREATDVASIPKPTQGTNAQLIGLVVST